MRKSLGTAVLALTLIAPAMASNNSTITYTLQVGGSNAGGPNVPFDTTYVKEAGQTPIYVMPWTVDVITWSVRVSVSGDIDGLPVGGAANVVWDLALLDSTGALVSGGALDTDGGFGITAGPAGEAGFFSTIMSNPIGGPLAQQPACFAWVFDVNGLGAGQPHGRLIDAVAANGPNMAQFTYPSTYRYYRLPGAPVPIDPGLVLAPSGTLMGMGAGYEDLDPANGLERAGVGILSSGDGYYPCYQAIGAKAPIAEGQINMRGLPTGTYKLVLTPGPGNNVVNTSQCASGTPGAFAAAATSVTGSTIEFIYSALPPPPIPSVTGGAVSRVFHSGSVAAYIDVPLFPSTIPTSGNVVTEPRRSTSGANPWIIAVNFDMPLGPGPVVTATGTNGNPALGTPVVAGNVLSIPITNWLDVNLITLSITNVTHALGSPPNPDPYVIKVIALQGDVNNNQVINVNDVNLASVHTGQPVTAANCRFDVAPTNGSINVGDVNRLSGLTGHNVAGTYP